MARHYDCIVRFYASWFDDLTNVDKSFSLDEIGQIVLKIAEAQIKGDADLINELPPTIRRGLQMATLREQLERMIERAKRCKERGSRGGYVTASRNDEERRRRDEERTLRDMEEREREKEKRRKEEKYRNWCSKNYDRFCELVGCDITELHRQNIPVNIYRKVWEEDKQKGDLNLVEWVVSLKMKTKEEAAQLYKGFLKN